MNDKKIILPGDQQKEEGSLQKRLIADPQSLEIRVLEKNPDREGKLYSEKLSRLSSGLFIAGFSLLMVSALIATLISTSPFAPLLSALGLLCHTVSKKLDQRELALQKKVAIRENQKLSQLLNPDRLTEDEAKNSDLEIKSGVWIGRIYWLIQVAGLLILSSSAVTPFLSSTFNFASSIQNLSKLTPTLMQLGFILFTAGAQLEEFQERHQKRLYRKANFDLKIELAKKLSQAK